jgi:hypothetical protein
MPFQSKKQVRWMFANDPEMAKEWASKTKDFKALPEKVRRKKKLKKRKQALYDLWLSALIGKTG